MTAARRLKRARFLGAVGAVLFLAGCAGPSAETPTSSPREAAGTSAKSEVRAAPDGTPPKAGRSSRVPHATAPERAPGPASSEARIRAQLRAVGCSRIAHRGAVSMARASAVDRDSPTEAT